MESVIYHGNGVLQVKRLNRLQRRYENSNGRKDRKVKELTRKSLALLTATMQATDVELKSMLTLTYPGIFPHRGQTVKEDLNRTLAFLRTRGMKDYCWFLEFQKRGAPHIHILSDIGTITPSMRVGLAHSWVGGISNSLWFFGRCATEAFNKDVCEVEVISSYIRQSFAVTMHRKTWELVREKDGAKRYVTAYATKPDQKSVPTNFIDVGRLWGTSRGLKLGKGLREITTREENLRSHLKANNHPVAEMDIIPKYLWNVPHID